MSIVKFSEIIAYKFEELPEDVQERIIVDRILFWLSNRVRNKEIIDNYEKAWRDVEKSNTPWQINIAIRDYCEEEIIKELIHDNFLYDEDGEIIPLKKEVIDDIEKYFVYLTNSLRIEAVKVPRKK